MLSITRVPARFLRLVVGPIIVSPYLEAIPFVPEGDPLKPDRSVLQPNPFDLVDL